MLPAPVEWVGWWLFTPLATCLEWNQRRQRLVPEPVIKELAWLDQRIRSATNRERQVQRHGFSAGLPIEAVPQGHGQGQALPLGALQQSAIGAPLRPTPSAGAAGPLD